MKQITQYKTIKKMIIDLGKKNNTYHKGITDLLIDDLIFQLDVEHAAKLDIVKRGHIINVSKTAEPYYNPNPSINVVHQCTKTVQSILRQLSLSPDAILKLKVDDSKGGLQKFLDKMEEE